MNITLEYREGQSDKVYQLSMVSEGTGYAVNFAYGRRGSTLNTGTKIPTPLPMDQAHKIFGKLLKEKLAKGYKPAAYDLEYTPPTPSKDTGIRCQLLNPADDYLLDSLFSNPMYWMQEKLDGKRLIIQKRGNEIIGINRLGLTTGLPNTIQESAKAYPRDLVIDGEAIGDTLYAFDLISTSGENLRHLRYAVRYGRLRDLLNHFDLPHIKLVPVYFGREKQEAFNRLKADGKEGVVFKDLDAPYTSGRPNSGGPQLKFKFYETASFIVQHVNDKRSVSLGLCRGKHVFPAGNVTIPPNHEVPPAGAIVECRYLYALKESGAIYQPVFLGRREDILPNECTTSQLKYKAEAA
jgi:bifunctional non-homologous end joining protein LigD